MFREKNQALQLTLEQASKAGSELRYRLVTRTGVVGSIGLFLSCMMHWLIRDNILDSSTFGHSGYYAALEVPFGSFALLACQGDDVFTIRFTSLLYMIVFFLFGGLSLMAGIGLWFSERHKVIHETENIDTPVCGVGVPDVGCVLWVVWSFVNGIFALAIALKCVRPNILFAPSTASGDSGSSIRRLRIGHYYNRKQRKGFRFRDSAFKLPARQALSNLWLAGRLWSGIIGIVTIAFSIISLSLRDNVSWFTYEDFYTNIINGCASIAVCMFYTPGRRRQIRALFASMSAQDQARSAAFVAALLGGRKAVECLELAEKKFRSISFGDLQSSDFVNNKEASSEVNRLFDKTVETKIGGCDAFISHSWSDNWEKKFAALQQWSGDFHSKGCTARHLESGVLKSEPFLIFTNIP